ncbi:methyl-accepting chemotaxis protein [Pontibacillus sp. ALD_SL1]|uniref:methyl-accepting chemotaxis protein n=1 Tax=Pontibacillus sp. ALD_SL1 TaxID=2777185 RepID=UPI001A9604A3|nr:methyl-accepting chemotaxis protein [Pontibacillus sp. ALD_SL1]QSS99691.1 methyl-accepting chemotaxis protein [Pontibacillus sp. ALD_SL1]
MEKDKKLSLLNDRNKLIIKLSWFSIVLSLLTNFTSHADWLIAGIIVGIGGTFTTIGTILTWKEIGVKYVMYIVMFSLTLITYFMVESNPHMISYLMVYYNLAVISVYQLMKPIAVISSLQIALTVLFYLQFGTEMFPNYGVEGLISLILYIVLVTAFLMFQARLNTKLQEESSVNEEEALSAKQRAEEMVTQVQGSLETLSNFSDSLKGNIEVTGRVSSEVTKTFNEMASAIEHQAAGVMDITSLVDRSKSNVDDVNVSSNSMKENTEKSVEVANKAFDQMNHLNGEIGSVNSIMMEAEDSMHQLQEEANEISDIILVINNVSEQTNLLALNAAIEAARAGEHGKGFAVVADEVRKLAEESKASTVKIASILEKIQSNIIGSVEKVTEGRVAVTSSQQNSLEIKNVLEIIKENGNNVVAQSQAVDGIIKQLLESSERTSDQINEVSSITQQTAAGVEEVLASVEEQNTKVNEIVEDYSTLEESIQSFVNVVNRS